MPPDLLRHPRAALLHESTQLRAHGFHRPKKSSALLAGRRSALVAEAASAEVTGSPAHRRRKRSRFFGRAVEQRRPRGRVSTRTLPSSSTRAMSEPKTDVAPPAGAVITVTVPAFMTSRLGSFQVSLAPPVRPGADFAQRRCATAGRQRRRRMSSWPDISNDCPFARPSLLGRCGCELLESGRRVG
jgi:hypothetical protein